MSGGRISGAKPRGNDENRSAGVAVPAEVESIAEVVRLRGAWSEAEAEATRARRS